jgi:Domain of unknown function (DUF4386)
MNPADKTARVAGLLYLLMGLPGFFGLMYVPGTIIVHGDAGATAANLLAHETLFRVGIVCELVNAAGFIFVVRALNRLLNGVNRTQASLMVTLFVVSVPISFLNVVSEIAALTLVRGADFLAVLAKPQRDALAMLFLGLHGHGIGVAAIFWGLWLFPFGVLVMKSGFLPRILGVLLIINGFAYPAVTLTWLLLPDYAKVVSQFALIPELGELWMMGWLLIRGVKAGPLRVPAAP